MSEKFFNNLGRFLKSPKKNPELSKENLLMAQVRRFTQGTQVVVEKYDPHSIFDVETYQPGTIFRIVADIEITSSGDPKKVAVYSWYITGYPNAEQQPTVYEIYYPDFSTQVNYMIDNPTLKLHPSLTLRKLNPARTKFGVLVAAKVLHGKNVPDDKSGIESQIEIMSSGLLQKVIKPNKKIPTDLQSKPLREFVPQPVIVHNKF